MLEKHSTPPQISLKDIFSCQSDEIVEESEYIYKTFDRGGGDFVTLLEENRDIIGHGTTGLTSWQGALFMADWLKANSSVVEVRTGSK